MTVPAQVVAVSLPCRIEAVQGRAPTGACFPPLTRALRFNVPGCHRRLAKSVIWVKMDGRNFINGRPHSPVDLGRVDLGGLTEGRVDRPIDPAGGPEGFGVVVS